MSSLPPTALALALVAFASGPALAQTTGQPGGPRLNTPSTVNPRTGLPTTTPSPSDPRSGLPSATVPTDPGLFRRPGTSGGRTSTGLPSSSVPADPRSGVGTTLPRSVDPRTGLPLGTSSDPGTGLSSTPGRVDPTTGLPTTAPLDPRTGQPLSTGQPATR